MKRLTFLMLCLLSNLAFAKLVIGTTGYAPPMAYKISPPNHYSGYEVSVMRAVCKRLKQSCHFATVLPSVIPQALNNNKIDLAVAQIIVPNEPLKGYSFSIPYVKSSASFMTVNGSPIHTLKDLRQKTIGVRIGTLEEGSLFAVFLLKLYDHQVNIKSFRNMHQLMEALNNQQVDAVFSNSAVISYRAAKNPDQYKTIGAPIPIGEGYGVMGLENKSDLMKQINRILLEMKADGTLQAMYKRYFGLQPAPPPTKAAT